jgi:hypothetical protein
MTASKIIAPAFRFTDISRGNKRTLTLYGARQQGNDIAKMLLFRLRYPW